MTTTIITLQMSSSIGVNYSDGKPDPDGKRSFFPWEYPVPDNQFWNDLPYFIGRNFLLNFAPEEIDLLPIDPNSSQIKEQKLTLLYSVLHKRLSEQDTASAPKIFYDVDFEGWDRLWLGIYAVEHELGRPEAEATIRMLCERRKDPENLSHVHTLAGLLLDKGEYAEAEIMVEKVKVWLEEKIGKDCPQIMRAWRIIVEAVWKQGKRDEAEALLEEMKGTIDGMEGGRFAVYQDEERGYYNEMVEELKKG